MASLTVSISTRELTQRLRERLEPGKSGTVIWQDGGDRVLLFAGRLRARSVDGWLLCDLDVQTDQTDRQTLQFVFYLGQRGDGDGPRAAATINAPTLAQAQLADRWGADIQRVLWDGVLDAVEVAVANFGDAAEEAVLLTGFHVDAEDLHVDVLVGDSHA
ncbi:MAG TPA: hypothetical protein VGR26_08480 [Acidimicrobiales bacterium]|nr:hypothetical protein [Acidimicrobiales bacterium]